MAWEGQNGAEVLLEVVLDDEVYDSLLTLAEVVLYVDLLMGVYAAVLVEVHLVVHVVFHVMGHEEDHMAGQGAVHVVGH